MAPNDSNDRGKGRLVLCTASISIHVFPKKLPLIEGYKLLLDLTFTLDFFLAILRKVANFNFGGKISAYQST